MRTEYATYLPYRNPEALNKGAQTHLHARHARGDSHGKASDCRCKQCPRRAADDLNPELPVVRINTAEQHLDDVLGQDRLVAVLSGALAGLAVSIACLGLLSGVVFPG